MEALEKAGLVSAESGWMLPEALRDHVGVIFASSFGHCEAALRKDNAEDRKLALDLILQANVQLAQLTKARAFNTFSSASCCSTTVAIKLAANAILAEDARYMLVVAADAILDGACEEVVSSFVRLKAASDAAEPYGKTAFSTERNGFFFGEGAVALLLADERAPRPPAQQRSVDLVASRIGNSAHHGTQIEHGHVRRVLEDAIDHACKRRAVTRSALARHCLYVSHETGTRLCAVAEVQALRAVFGEDARRVVITNTKSRCGHMMGACVEDAVAVTALLQQRAPAVDVSSLDADFADLRFADGRSRRLDWAVHVAYGMGSQVAVCVYALAPFDDDTKNSRP
tara:strand:- start:20720 stop:21745 length:1026 start_codon:yes stop_codon:yes gene_type:complete